MPAPLLIAALCLLIVGVATVAAVPRAVRERRWLGGLIRTLVGALLLFLGVLAATISAGIRGYRALTYEEVAAKVKTEPVGLQRFRATIVLPDQRLAMYELAGDAFYVDAHILKWHPWANLVGLHTAYELDRVAGRYNSVSDERARPHTVYSLSQERVVDVFFLARRFRLFGPLVDAQYGSAAFVAGAEAAGFEERGGPPRPARRPGGQSGRAPIPHLIVGPPRAGH